MTDTVKKNWPDYWTARAFPDRRRTILAHSPRQAAHLAGAHFWPAPDGQDVTAEPTALSLTTWSIFWTDATSSKRVGAIQLEKGIRP
jgi:hypothetical protein